MKRTKNESGVKRIITRKEKKKDEKNRFMNMEKKLKGKLKTAYILGDTMVKRLNGYLLTRKR